MAEDAVFTGPVTVNLNTTSEVHIERRAGSIRGLLLSNSAIDAANDIDIAPGSARDSGDTSDLVLPVGITKRLDAAWQAGTDNGGLDAGVKAPSTGYHAFLVGKEGTDDADVIFSTSAINPVLPVGWDARRRIGSFMTDASGNIRPFHQAGGWFTYRDQTPSDGGSINLTTTVLQRLSVPLGVKFECQLFVITSSAPATPGWMLVRDPESGIPPTVGTGYGVYYRNAQVEGFSMRCFTDHSGQVYLKDDTVNGYVQVQVRSYFDHRDEHL